MIKIDVMKIPEESVIIEKIPKENYLKIETEIIKLQENGKAKRILLLDKEGKTIVSKIDYNNTNTEKEIAEYKKIIEKGGYFVGSPSKCFSDSMHVSIIAESFVLVIIFDEESSLGLVRLSLKHCKNELESFLLYIILQIKEDYLLNDKLLFLLNPITDSEMDEFDFLLPSETFSHF